MYHLMDGTKPMFPYLYLELGKRFCNEDHTPILTIDGLWYRKPLEVIKEGSWTRYQRSIISRLTRMLEMEGEMRRNPPLDNVETVVVPVKLYSDSTVLSTIGLGNLSKYIGLRPSSFSDNHIAYIPSLPQSIKREYRRLLGKSPTSPVF
ncbi:hypothetical protein K435DRAFT_796835 [Dendrothele bispora CBS 962.96]|uniref:Uncharacterized protein n=1 Tax=Dendrothele bispora (strain CBS 962.96) TaxID=1314807 RepID=A0A4S8M5P1_DENBC|nr:hypothetical protein K435DRAFT_796835 [Dendrothele bispora CBS 962.96]